MAVNVGAVTHLAAAAPQTLPKEAVSRKWVKIKVARVSNRNGDQRDEGGKRFPLSFQQTLPVQIT